MQVNYQAAANDLSSLFMLALRAHDSWPTLIGIPQDGDLTLEVVNCPNDYGAVVQSLGSLIAAINEPDHMDMKMTFPNGPSSPPRILIETKDMTHVLKRKAKKILLENTRIFASEPQVHHSEEEGGHSFVESTAKKDSAAEKLDSKLDENSLANKAIDMQLGEIKKFCKEVPAVDMQAHYMLSLAKLNKLPAPLLKKIEAETTIASNLGVILASSKATAGDAAQATGPSPATAEFPALAPESKPAPPVEKQLEGLFTLILKSYAPKQNFSLTKMQGGKLTMDLYNTPEDDCQGIMHDIAVYVGGFNTPGIDREFGRTNRLSINIFATVADPVLKQKSLKTLQSVNKNLGPWITDKLAQTMIDKNNKDYPSVNMSGRLLMRMASELNLSDDLQRELREEVGKHIKR